MSDRTILSPANANALNGLFNGSTAIDVSAVNVNGPCTAETFTTTVGGTSTFDVVNIEGDLTLGASSASVQLTGTADTVTVAGAVAANSVDINGDLTLIKTGTNNTAVLSCTDPNTISTTASVVVGVLTVEGNCAAETFTTTTAGTSTFDDVSIVGTCTATAFRGGIIFHIIEGLNPGTLAPSTGYIFPNVEIPNFVGSASSAYLISCNNQAGVPYLPVVFTITYASNDGTNTYVNIGIMNVSTTTSYGAIFDVSIIAMN
jgi:hypothetical protein